MAIAQTSTQTQSSGQATQQAPSRSYYNYYDQYGNQFYPGGTQPVEQKPYRNGTQIKYGETNGSGYSDTQYDQGPPGSGRAYRQNGKIIYR